jgi:hypothetical protein
MKYYKIYFAFLGTEIGVEVVREYSTLKNAILGAKLRKLKNLHYFIIYEVSGDKKKEVYRRDYNA